MRSVAKYAKDKAIGVVLTGMGRDGAKGLLEMKQAGAATFAQSERTCVVYGMPAAAVQLGAADKIEDLEKIGPAIIDCLLKKSAA
jgi:two-component system chemotaxis response regulator CheB